MLYIQYIAYSPFDDCNASPIVCLRGCAIACAECATQQTFAQCTIFLEATLNVSPLVTKVHTLGHENKNGLYKQKTRLPTYLLRFNIANGTSTSYQEQK